MTGLAARPASRSENVGQGLANWWRDVARWFAEHGVDLVLSALAAAAIAFALFALKRLLVGLCRRDDPSGWRSILGRVVARTGRIFIVLLAARLVVGYAAPPPKVATTIGFLFIVAAVFQAATWARELIIGVIERRAGFDGYHGDAIANAMGLIKVLVTVALFAVALIVVLDNLGVNVTGLVAGLGVGGIAIGLAAQGIFSDLFAALAILFDKPFRRGDTIRFGDTSGTVEEIGLKSTRIRAVGGEEVIVSNTELLKKELRNLTRLERRRLTGVIKLAPGTTADQLERVPALIAEALSGIPKCAFVRAGVRGFVTAGIEIELHYDVRSGALDEVFAAQHAVNTAIVRRFAAEKIALAAA